MKFVVSHIGENAFYNIVGGSEVRIRRRFYPTIFDSICIAVSTAMKQLGEDIPTNNLEEKRLRLLQDDDYRKYTTEGTMQPAHINGRVNLVLKYLFDIDYE